MKISVVGTGYVGLVTGACLADHGNQVVCADISEEKIARLEKAEIPFFEPNLEDLVERNLREGRLKFSSDVKAAIEQAKLHFICVGTPFVDDIGSLNTEPLLKVVTAVADHAASGDLLIIKSTVPVGTASKATAMLKEKGRDDLWVVSNPEFLKEGEAVEDFMKPDRVVVGVKDVNSAAAECMRVLYKPFVRTGNPIVVTDNTSAEMIKLASNGFLATRISYMNEIANLCETTGADVAAVRRGMGLDSRIGHRYLFPGLGYGGSCFPKDIRELIHLGESYDFGARLLQAVHAVNEQQRQAFLDKIDHAFDGQVSGKTLAIWGMAFKANTDDIRDAPSIDIMAALLDKGAILRVYDPEAMDNVKKVFGDKLTYCDNSYDCLEDADGLCVCTEWRVFRNPDFDRLKSLMKGNFIFDGRNLYTDENLSAQGFSYYHVGQPFGKPVSR